MLTPPVCVGQATHEIHAGPALLAAAHRALRLAGCGNGGGRTLSPSTYAALSLVFSSFYTALLYSDAAHTGEFAYAFMRKMGTLGRAGACAGCAAAKASLAAACAAALGRDAARTGASTGRDEEDKVKAAARARPLATAAAAAAGTSSNKLE